ncbi:MAG TPA: hypothetical protein VFL98_00050 [Candidatus Paceibacterota bacterium]|nr:hypothetical protein [Candidatus Paceibacterota bacterium]
MTRRSSALLSLAPASALLVPALASAAVASTFSGLVSFIVNDFIDLLIPVLISAAVLLYMRNTATGIFKLQKGEVDPNWRRSMLWGIIAIVLMVSLWGILAILAATFQIPVIRG